MNALRVATLAITTALSTLGCATEVKPPVSPAAPIENVALEILRAERVVVGDDRAAEELLHRVLEDGRNNVLRLPRPRTNAEALAVLGAIEETLCLHHFAYPAEGFVGTLHDALSAKKVDEDALRAIASRRENQTSRRRAMLEGLTADATVHLADADTLSILYAAIGELAGLPIHVVDLPPPRWGGAGHTYVRYSLGSETVNWDSAEGVPRFAAYDAKYFTEAPKTLDEARASRAFAVAMNRQELLAYAHRYVAGALVDRGDLEHAIEELRAAIALSPSSPRGYSTLVWLLGTCPEVRCRDVSLATKYAEMLVRIWADSEAFEALAYAYAAARRFPDAAAAQCAAVRIVGDESSVVGRLLAYQRQRPLEPPSPAPWRRCTTIPDATWAHVCSAPSAPPADEEGRAHALERCRPDTT